VQVRRKKISIKRMFSTKGRWLAARDSRHHNRCRLAGDNPAGANAAQKKNQGGVS